MLCACLLYYYIVSLGEIPNLILSLNVSLGEVFCTRVFCAYTPIIGTYFEMRENLDKGKMQSSRVAKQKVLYIFCHIQILQRFKEIFLRVLPVKTMTLYQVEKKNFCSREIIL